MARITVEDCLVQIPNRFQLVLAATYRARMLNQGHTAQDRKQEQAWRDRAARNCSWQDRHRDAEKSTRSKRVRTIKAPLAVLFFGLEFTKGQSARYI